MIYILLKTRNDHETLLICNYNDKDTEKEAHLKILNFLFGKNGFLCDVIKNIFEQDKPNKIKLSPLLKRADFFVHLEDPYEEKSKSSINSELEKRFQEVEQDQKNILYNKLIKTLQNQEKENASAIFKSVAELKNAKRYFFIEEKEFD